MNERHLFTGSIKKKNKKIMTNSIYKVKECARKAEPQQHNGQALEFKPFIGGVSGNTGVYEHILLSRLCGCFLGRWEAMRGGENSASCSRETARMAPT